MLKQLLILTTLCSTYAFSENNHTQLQSNTVEINYKDKNGTSIDLNVGRNLSVKCKQLLIANETFWSGNHAGFDVPEACKATFVTTSGQLSPMIVAEGVETFGELEVLDFIEEMQEDEQMLLVDTRKPLWFEYRTIPSAINISFEYILRPHLFEKEFKIAMKTLGVKGVKKPYDFSKAKTIVLFCNASWCGQSPAMINSLLSFGYPAEKLKWYRGGMASWLNLNMTTTKK